MIQTVSPLFDYPTSLSLQDPNSDQRRIILTVDQYSASRAVTLNGKKLRLLLAWLMLVACSSGLAQKAPAIVEEQPANQKPRKVHDPAKTEPLTLVLRPEGFGIKSIEIPAGRYALNFYNRTGVKNLPAVFERVLPGNSQAPEKVRERNGNERESKFSEFLTLTKGTYRFKVENRAAWTIEIAVK